MRVSNRVLRKTSIKGLILSTAFFICVFVVPSVPVFGQTAQVTPPSVVNVDPFYEECYERGKSLYDKGDYAGAIENLEIAFFGYLEYPERLLESYMYLSVSYYFQKNEEKCNYYIGKIKELEAQQIISISNMPPSLREKYLQISAGFSPDVPKIAAPVQPPPKPAPATAVKTEPKTTPALKTTPTLETKKVAETKAVPKAEPITVAKAEQKPAFSSRTAQKPAPAAARAAAPVPPNPSPRTPPSFESALDQHYELGKRYYDRGDINKAYLEFVYVRKINKDYKDAGRYAAAINDRAKAGASEAQHLRIHALHETSLNKKIGLFRQALEADPTNTDFYFEMKDIYVFRQKYREAADLLKPLLTYYPDMIRLYIELGRVYLSGKTPDEAVQILTRGFVVDPDNLEVRYLLGRAYLDTAKFREAADQFAFVLARDPSYKDTRSLRQASLVANKRYPRVAQ